MKFRMDVVRASNFQVEGSTTENARLGLVEVTAI